MLDMLYNANILMWLSENLQLDGVGLDVVHSPVAFHVLYKHLLFVPPQDDCHQQEAQHTDEGLQRGICQEEGCPGGGPGPGSGGKEMGKVRPAEGTSRVFLSGRDCFRMEG